MVIEPQCVWPLAAELGEGPVWLPSRGRDVLHGALYFVDIKGRRMHRWREDGAHSTWLAPEPVGFIQPVRDGGWVAGFKSGLYRFDEPAHSLPVFKCLLAPEPSRPNNRLNDAFTDAQGYLWFGSMDDAEEQPSGQLYCMNGQGRASAQDAGYIITNGPCTSPDGRTFYHTDTLAKTIYAFDVDTRQTLTNRRVLIRVERGYPDGTVVDAAGCLWVSLFAGGAVQRYSPRGELLQTVEFPCPNITKIAFGGADLRTAYATTAWKGMSAREREKYPLAGGLFTFSVDTPGLPQNLIQHGLDEVCGAG